MYGTEDPRNEGDDWVWIYVDHRHPVGHPGHLKVFASNDAALDWFKENDLEGVAFAYPVIGMRENAV